jgi:hypothetical protein
MHVVAVRANALGQAIQLTDFYGKIIAGSSQWANDGQDTFISFLGTDVSAAVEVIAPGVDGDGRLRQELDPPALRLHAGDRPREQDVDLPLRAPDEHSRPLL